MDAAWRGAGGGLHPGLVWSAACTRRRASEAQPLGPPEPGRKRRARLVPACSGETRTGQVRPHASELPAAVHSDTGLGRRAARASVLPQVPRLPSTSTCEKPRSLHLSWARSRCPTPKLSPRPRERCSSQRLCHRRTVTWKSRKRERRLGAEPGGSPLLTPRS